MIKSIFNSGKNKAGVGMKIPSWMITEEMKLTEHYRMYAMVFGVDVPTTHLAEQKSLEELEAEHHEEKVKDHLMAEEIEKLVEGAKNVEEHEVDSTTLRKNENQIDPGTRLEVRSDKESPEVKITIAEQPINVNEEEEESAEDDYELKRREKGKHVEDYRNAIQKERENLRAEISSQINNAINNHIPSQDDPHDDAHPEGENSAKRQKTSEHGFFVFRESSSDDDELPTEKVSQELVEEMSQTVDEAKLSKVNPHAKVFYIKKQKEPGKPKEAVYSNSKIFQIIKTYWELRHEHKFITEIIIRRENGSIVSITESDYKNLNKNAIEDIYLLIVNVKLGVESYQQKVNLTTPIVTFSGIKKYKVFFIVSEPVYDIIYKNNKKEKIVMRHQEIHKFRDATLKRVWEGLNNYNNDVKHAYVTPSLSKEDTEYLQLFEEEIEEWLNHRDQMRRCEMYVNERPLGSRKERPE
ncbi:hypothetical protein Tco_0227832 [Tanacetum coccineum]